MCPPGYHHNGFVATHVLLHMMYGYTLLVPMNQRVPNKHSKEHNINVISDHDKQSAQISQKQDGCNIYVYYDHLLYIMTTYVYMYIYIYI